MISANPNTPIAQDRTIIATRASVDASSATTAVPMQPPKNDPAAAVLSATPAAAGVTRRTVPRGQFEASGTDPNCT